eukprot:ctg_4955.g600
MRTAETAAWTGLHTPVPSRRLLHRSAAVSDAAAGGRGGGDECARPAPAVDAELSAGAPAHPGGSGRRDDPRAAQRHDGGAARGARA